MAAKPFFVLAWVGVTAGLVYALLAGDRPVFLENPVTIAGVAMLGLGMIRHSRRQAGAATETV